MEAETANRVRRPAGLWLLTIALLASPAFHLLALLLDRRWLNFGSHHPWDAFVYFVIAPVVGTLMLRRHERARFSVYVFLSCEILRAIRIHSGLLGLLAAGAILYLQLPAARRVHPSVDPPQGLARLRLGPPTSSTSATSPYCLPIVAAVAPTGTAAAPREAVPARYVQDYPVTQSSTANTTTVTVTTCSSHL